VVTINPARSTRGSRDAGRVPLSNDVPLRGADKGDPRGACFPGTPVRFPSRDRRRSAVDARVYPVPRAIERTDGLCELWVRQRLSALLGPFFARWGKSPGTAATEPGNERAVRRAADYFRANAAAGVLLRDAAARCGTLPVPLSPNVYEGPMAVSPHAYRMLRCVELARTSILPGASACPGVSRRRLRRSEPLHAVFPRRIRRRSRFVSPRVRRRAISFKMKRFSSCSLRSWG
jgi:hypothetical protein